MNRIILTRKILQFSLYLLILFWFVILSSEANAGKCYAKDDVGLGGEYVVPSVAEPVSSNRYFINKSRDDTQVRLLRTGPDKGKQFISWLDTGLVVTVDSDKLLFYVDGAWAPWGKENADSTCKCIDPCSSNGNPDNICASGGVQVSSNYNGSACYNGKFVPCTIQFDEDTPKSNMYGLYGLIASSNGSSTSTNPNNKLYWDNLPPELFRTFQILPDSSGFFTLSQTQSCVYKPGDAEPTCTSDTVTSLSDQFNESYKYPIMQGKLYLKILDGYYEDNDGFYNVVVSYGAFDSMGVIESAINGFTGTIVDAANAINASISADTSLLEIISSMLFLYIILNGILFAMGMIKSSVSELIKRLFKIGIIATALSPTSFDFFNTYIFSFIQDGFSALSEMILDATEDPRNPLQASFAVRAGQSPLSVYDKILNSLTSNAVHVKIWSLLFFKWGGLYIIAIYLGIFYMLLALGKTVMMYIIATINMAILIALFPFFIVMILFQITQSFFDSWIKSFLANAVTIMLIFASIAIVMTLLFGLLQTLLAFKVCWKPVWDLPLLDKLNFWLPSSYSDVKKAVTLVNVLAFVVVAIVFDKFTGEIPTISESITGGSSGIKSAFTALSKAMEKALKSASALNPVGLAISAYSAMKKGRGMPMKPRAKLSPNAGGKGNGGKDGKTKDPKGPSKGTNAPSKPITKPPYDPTKLMYNPNIRIDSPNKAELNPTPPSEPPTPPTPPVADTSPPVADTSPPIETKPNIEPSIVDNPPQAQPMEAPLYSLEELRAMKDTMAPFDYTMALVSILDDTAKKNAALIKLNDALCDQLPNIDSSSLSGAEAKLNILVESASIMREISYNFKINNNILTEIKSRLPTNKE